MNTCHWGHNNCSLQSKHLEVLSQKTVLDWRTILRNLALGDDFICAIEEDCMTRNITKSVEITYESYLKWQRKEGDHASICRISTALELSGRRDVLESLKKIIVQDASNQCPLFICLSQVTYGRKVEIEKVVSFCKSEKDRLLVITGMPGVGKAQLINCSLKKVLTVRPSLNVVAPMIYPENETDWSMEVLAEVILQIMQPNECWTRHRVAGLEQTFANLKNPTLLVLDISQLIFKHNAKLIFWKFVHRVLQPNHYLKILVSECEKPDFSQMDGIAIEQIALYNLERCAAVKLLQKMCNRLKTEHCKQIYRHSGGNPSILRKLGAHINNFKFYERELADLLHSLEGSTENQSLQMIMQKTVLERDMGITFDQLNETEKLTLATLCCFSDRICISVLKKLYGRNMFENTKHLHNQHSFIESSQCGSFYRMGEITRTFVKKRCFENKVLHLVYIKAKCTYIKEKLKVLNSYDNLYFNPKVTETTYIKSLIENYKTSCKCCIQKCECVLARILIVSFQREKNVILCEIKHGLEIDDILNDVVDKCLPAVHFLRNVLAYNELQELFEMIFNKVAEKQDLLRMAATLASLVFIKVFHKVKHELTENICQLTEAIEQLEKEKEKSDLFLEVLAIAYFHRGYLHGFCHGMFRRAKKDIIKGSQHIKLLNETPRSIIAELTTHGYMSAIFYQNGMYENSIKKRIMQVSGYRSRLGVHPYTAKSLHYHSQCLSQVQSYSSALTCCLVSRAMYGKIFGRGLSTIRVLSTYGKTLIKAGEKKEGIECLEKVVNHAKTALGEHYFVADCYEQLAQAKEDVNSSQSIEVDDLRRKAQLMRQEMSQAQKELSPSDGERLKLPRQSIFIRCRLGKPDSYGKFVLVFMLFAIAMHIYLHLRECVCARDWLEY